MEFQTVEFQPGLSGGLGGGYWTKNTREAPGAPELQAAVERAGRELCLYRTVTTDEQGLITYGAPVAVDGCVMVWPDDGAPYAWR